MTGAKRVGLHWQTSRWRGKGIRDGGGGEGGRGGSHGTCGRRLCLDSHT